MEYKRKILKEADAWRDHLMFGIVFRIEEGRTGQLQGGTQRGNAGLSTCPGAGLGPGGSVLVRT